MTDTPKVRLIEVVLAEVNLRRDHASRLDPTRLRKAVYLTGRNPDKAYDPIQDESAVFQSVDFYLLKD